MSKFNAILPATLFKDSSLHPFKQYPFLTNNIYFSSIISPGVRKLLPYQSDSYTIATYSSTSSSGFLTDLMEASLLVWWEAKLAFLPQYSTSERQWKPQPTHSHKLRNHPTTATRATPIIITSTCQPANAKHTQGDCSYYQ